MTCRAFCSGGEAKDASERACNAERQFVDATPKAWEGDRSVLLTFALDLVLCSVPSRREADGSAEALKSDRETAALERIARDEETNMITPSI